MLAACTSTPISDYKATQPIMDFQQYFNGPIKAWGIIQNWRGQMVSQFDVTMQGSWEGNEGTLTEQFVFYDGKRQQRIWRIKKLPSGRYEGRADDILGVAQGDISGSAVHWRYEMNLPVDNTTYRIKFDDWMWAMNDGVVVNRSYLKKFGFTVAELTLFMKKQPHE
jgi:hypothetical protein